MRGVPPMTNLPSGDYVFQRTIPELANAADIYGNRMQIRRNLPQINPNTPQQQLYRAKFRIGVSTWHTLAPEEKSEWAKIGRARGLNSFQAYMSNYMKG